ncbi:MAG: FAD-binding protein [Ilumatobacteraceae bacterium]
MSEVSSEVDLAVVGGGMAGLTAAARASRGGASVLVIDRAVEVGGSARYAGFLWTAPTDDVLADIDPDGDPALRHALVAGYGDAVAWVRSLDVPVGDEVTILRYGRGRSIDTAAYIAACVKVVADAGGTILTDAVVDGLVVDGGAVSGLEVRTSDGTSRRIDATSTLIATGGYQGDRELTASLIHPNAPLMPLRTNPTSAGAGLRLAQQAGAAFGHGGAGFYGHLVLADVPLDDPMQFANQTLYYSEHALVFNRRGERFIDETLGDHLSAIAAVEQPEARVLVVADQRVRDEWMLGEYVEGITPVDRFDLCRRRDGRYALADSLEDFDYLPEEWGYPGEVIRAAIEHFNAAARAGSALDPGRRFDPLPLDVPPYYVVEAQAAITFTFGGILADDRARALGTDGRPVPGLLVAGADAGGLFFRAYAGGLAAAAVFGLRAAETALAKCSAVRDRHDAGGGTLAGTELQR